MRLIQKIGLFFLAVLASLGFVGCGAEPTATPVLPTATASPTFFPTPTATPALPTVPPTATLAPTPRPTATPALTPLAPVGELPAPANARRLNLTIAILQRAKNIVAPNLQVDLTRLQVGAFAADGATNQPVDIFDFYRQVMPAQGWVESKAYDKRFGIYFTKGSQVAAIGAIGVPDEQTVLFLATFAPEVRKEIQGGEILILLGQGPAATFEALKRDK